MIAGLKEKTGRALEEWQAIIAERKLAKHGEIMNLLKGEFGVTHGFANQIALRSRPSASDEGSVTDDPIEAIFVKRPDAKVIFDELLGKIQGFGSDVDIALKKGYVSIRRSKQFAILQPAAGRLDVGINLKGAVPNSRLELSGSFNAMVSHRVRVGSNSELDEQLMGWLRKAYESA